jgi:hypothetical protein
MQCLYINIYSLPSKGWAFFKRLAGLQANRVSTATRHFVAFKPPGLRFDRLPGALSLCFELPPCRNMMKSGLILYRPVMLHRQRACDGTIIVPSLIISIPSRQVVHCQDSLS